MNHNITAGVCLAIMVFASEWALARDPNPIYEPSLPDAFATAPNLFRGAKVTASSHVFFSVPDNAVNGRNNVSGENWAGEPLPAWLNVDLGEPQEINAIRLWTYWGDGRHYQYFIEASADGVKWELLADRRDNSAEATGEGESFLFPIRKARYVRTTFTSCSVENRAHIVEIAGCLLPETAVRQITDWRKSWQAVAAGLRGAFGSTDIRYGRNEVPTTVSGTQQRLTGWRGERVSTQIVLWTAAPVRQVRFSVSPLVSKTGRSIPARCVTPRFVRYVLAGDRLPADIIDTADSLDLAGRTVRPVWVSVDVPRSAAPDTYRGKLKVLARDCRPLSFDLEVKVQPMTLPRPHDWKFHLDLWQNPYAVARYHHVTPWSPAHFALLKPHLQMLAEAGQKNLTTTIVFEAWGKQTYDPYDSMVRWFRQPDGSWKYDFAVFDRYVEFAADCGLNRNIVCYSMVPWTNRFAYIEQATGDTRELVAVPGEKAYDDHWRPFLQAFTRHLARKGWLERTYIGMDERPSAVMKPLLALVRDAAPELKIALAGGNEPELADEIDDWCVFIAPPLDPSVAERRAKSGRPTTFYVCCGPEKPNTFTFSPPAEAEWLGIYAAARQYSGFLRWAYDSWTQDPLFDTEHVTWSAGDCFLVYPNARTSIRFERLRQGIQDFEKIRILRETVARDRSAPLKRRMAELETHLERFTYVAAQNTPASTFVHDARSAIDRASDAAGR